MPPLVWAPFWRRRSPLRSHSTHNVPHAAPRTAGHADLRVAADECRTPNRGARPVLRHPIWCLLVDPPGSAPARPAGALRALLPAPVWHRAKAARDCSLIAIGPCRAHAWPCSCRADWRRGPRPCVPLGLMRQGWRLFFHWRAILLPPPIVDYVIAHELVHLREPHHTPAFWTKLERLMPDFPRRKQWLAESARLVDAV